MAMRFLIPGYNYPPGTFAPWRPSVSSTTVGGWLVANPASGPGATVDPNYVAAMQEARNAGISIMAYVSTQWGNRASTDVMADMDSWIRMYGGLFTGFFFDEMSTDCSKVSIYQSYCQYGASRNVGVFALNPGMAAPQCYDWNTGAAYSLILVTFENSAGAYLAHTPPAWEASAINRISHLVYEAQCSQMSALVSKAAASNVTYFYATDDALLSQWGPWNAISSTCLQNQISAMQLVNNPTGGGGGSTSSPPALTFTAPAAGTTLPLATGTQFAGTYTGAPTSISISVAGGAPVVAQWSNGTWTATASCTVAGPATVTASAPSAAGAGQATLSVVYARPQEPGGGGSGTSTGSAGSAKVTKTVTPANPGPGKTVTYTLTIDNAQVVTGVPMTFPVGYQIVTPLPGIIYSNAELYGGGGTKPTLSAISAAQFKVVSNTGVSLWNIRRVVRYLDANGIQTTQIDGVNLAGSTAVGTHSFPALAAAAKTLVYLGYESEYSGPVGPQAMTEWYFPVGAGSALTNVPVSDVLPGCLTGVSWSRQVVGAASGTGAATGTSKTITDSITCAANAKIIYTINATVGTGCVGVVTNTAMVGSTPVSADFTVTPVEVDLTLAKLAKVDKVQPGKVGKYWITLTNVGATPAAGRLTDPMTDGILSRTWTSLDTTTGLIGANGSGGGSLDMPVSLQPNQIIQIEVLDKVKPDVPITQLDITNTALFALDPGMVDKTPTTPVTARIPIAFPGSIVSQSTPNRSTVLPGQTIVYTMTVENESDDPAASNTVTATAPVPTDVESWTWTRAMSPGLTSAVASSGSGVFAQQFALPGRGKITYTVTAKIKRTGVSKKVQSWLKVAVSKGNPPSDKLVETPIFDLPLARVVDTNLTGPAYEGTYNWVSDEAGCFVFTIEGYIELSFSDLDSELTVTHPISVFIAGSPVPLVGRVPTLKYKGIGVVGKSVNYRFALTVAKGQEVRITNGTRIVGSVIPNVSNYVKVGKVTVSRKQQ